MSDDEPRSHYRGIENEFTNPPSAQDFADFRSDVSMLLGKYARDIGRPCKIKVEIEVTEILDSGDESEADSSE